jgi:hypothetical protein
VYIREVSLVTVATLILSVAIVRAVAPDDVTDATYSSIQTEVPVYDLQVGHSNVANLPVDAIPLP